MRVVTSVQGLIDTLIELVGIKSGLAITEDELFAILERAYAATEIEPGDSDRWWEAPRDSGLAPRAEEIETDFLLVMRGVGAIPDTRTPMELAINWVGEHAPREHGESFEDYVQRVQQILMAAIGEDGLPSEAAELGAEVRKRWILNRSLPERRDWDGIIALSDLFHSEDIPAATVTGAHFDQRFIDYLLAQPERLRAIHWRQFEYLCGEYFRRNGYTVEVTPPRGDGGIDVIARRDKGIVGPELILIQAKRLANTYVEINDVKALWSDAEEHKATRAVIVTTTRLEAGARAFCEARKYKINAAEGEDVRRWLAHMRQPPMP